MYRKMYYVYVDENHEIKISLVTVTVNLKTNQKVCGGLWNIWHACTYLSETYLIIHYMLINLKVN